METMARPEVDSGSTTTSSHEQMNEKAPKITEKTANKSEPKLVKSNKKLKEEEKKLSKLYVNSVLTACQRFFSILIIIW